MKTYGLARMLLRALPRPHPHTTRSRTCTRRLSGCRGRRGRRKAALARQIRILHIRPDLLLVRSYVTSSPLPKLVPFFVLLSRFVTPAKHFCSSTSARRRKLSSFEDTHGQLSFLMPLKFLPPLVFSLFVNL